MKSNRLVNKVSLLNTFGGIVRRFTTCFLAISWLASTAMPALAEQIFYGSRAGMTVTVVSKSGIGTENAVIVVEHRPEDAKAFCVEYSGDNSMQCVRRTMADVKVEPQVFANCKTGMWSDFYAERFALLGEKSPADPYVKYDIRRVSTGDILDGSSASGYDTALGIFQALCPGMAD